ncbi:MAG: SPASM domain-containing protein, partial [Anaerolineaceae bacterium]|nr:SPASM domain-containing protein [Anaerolineaceae bacterium]
RVGKDGKPTHVQVMDGLKFLQEHQVDFNVLTTVHTANADHPMEVYRFLRDEVDARFIQFIPIVERDNDNGFQEGRQATDRSVKGRAYGRFLIEIFDDWVRHDVGETYVQIFDVTLGVWVGKPGSLCVFAPTCGTALAIEHNGDLYACDHFVEPRYHLGNILHTHMAKLAASKKQIRFGMDKRDRLPGFCRRCEVYFACHGGCPKNRFSSTPDGKRGLNYLCDGYKMFFKHVEEPMRIMANLLRQGRPPSEIMLTLPAQAGNDAGKDHL